MGTTIDAVGVFMLKQLFDAGRCLLGGHQGDWELERPDGCQMKQTCRVCGRISERTEHVWAPWTLQGETSCRSTRSCSRCRVGEERIEHTWSDWTYKSAASCDQGRVCERCHVWHDESRLVHTWAAWEYSEAHRGPVRVCARCLTRESRLGGAIEPATGDLVGDELDRIVAETAARLKRGDGRDTVAAGATGAIQAIEARLAAQMDGAAQTPATLVALWWARTRVIAVTTAHQVIEAVTVDNQPLPNADSIQQLAAAWAAGETVEPAAFVQAISSILDASDQDPATLLNAAVPVLGMALLFNPAETSAFEGIRDRLAGLVVLLGGSESPGEVARPASAERDRFTSILADYSAVLERDGFSEYAFQRAFAEIREAPEAANAPQRVYQSLIGLIDASAPYATGEIAQVLAITRTGLTEQWNASESPPLTIGEAQAEADRILQRLQSSLEAGEPPSVASTRALVAFQTLSGRLNNADADANEEGFKQLMTTMLRINEIIAPYAPEETRQVGLDAMAAASAMVKTALDADPDDVVEQAILERQPYDMLGRALPTIDAWAMGPEWGAVTHVRAVAELVPRVLDRLLSPSLDTTAPGDGAELKRLRDRFDARLKVLRHATNEAEFIAPQREGLRATALEFREFERRRHLMVIDPALPAGDVTRDANRIFFSGSETVMALTGRAAHTIGMSLSPVHGLSNRSHERWRQLRSAGVALFDYSAFNPASADPPEWPTDPSDEAAILEAAGPVAAVAYETGWAYVLGKPMVTVAADGHPVPFDIDVAPVMLDGTSRDADRLVEALHAACYGIPYGTPGDCLADTIAFVRRRYQGNPDEQIQALLREASPADATRARALLAAIIDRGGGTRPMVCVPTFAGGYPTPGGHLFHITAFREWTTAAQAAVRAACARATVEYRIGSERMGADILRDVWRDICDASFIVADITNLNPNAVLELGIAHALGRPTLIITRNARPHAYLPAIEKVRTHRYDPQRRADLATLLDRFLQGTA